MSVRSGFRACERTFKHHQGVSMPLDRPFVYVFEFSFYTNVCMLTLSCRITNQCMSSNDALWAVTPRPVTLSVQGWPCERRRVVGLGKALETLFKFYPVLATLLISVCCVLICLCQPTPPHSLPPSSRRKASFCFFPLAEFPLSVAITSRPGCKGHNIPTRM
jgi:hypothetical protein